MPIASAYTKELIAPSLPIKPGATDAKAVTLLQEWLVVRGYDVGLNRAADPRSKAAAGIDGDFGNKTLVACRNFAHDFNFPFGEVDADFWARLVSPMTAAYGYKIRSRTYGEAMVELAHVFSLQAPREARIEREGRVFGLDNSGPWVRAFMHGFEGRDWPWCQGAVDDIVEKVCRDLGILPPIGTILDGVRSLYVPRFVTEAKRTGTFLDGRAAVGGKGITPGSMFFVRGERGGQHSHVHVGIVNEVKGHVFTTFEGNTNDTGSANGIAFVPRQRAVISCDFGLAP